MNIREMTKKEQIKLAMEWFNEEDISAYSDESVSEDKGTIYVKIGDYDYEISADEIYYRAELVLENKENEDE